MRKSPGHGQDMSGFVEMTVGNGATELRMIRVHFTRDELKNKEENETLGTMFYNLLGFRISFGTIFRNSRDRLS